MKALTTEQRLALISANLKALRRRKPAESGRLLGRNETMERILGDVSHAVGAALEGRRIAKSAYIARRMPRSRTIAGKSGT